MIALQHLCRVVRFCVVMLTLVMAVLGLFMAAPMREKIRAIFHLIDFNATGFITQVCPRAAAACCVPRLHA